VDISCLTLPLVWIARYSCFGAFPRREIAAVANAERNPVRDRVLRLRKGNDAMLPYPRMVERAATDR
jgi:hypothetical protein